MPAARGDVSEEDIWPGFRDKVLSFVDVDAMRPLRVVIDAANGMAGAMLPPVLERLPIEAVRCYFEPDGTFPNHEPNPLLPENREFIVAKTLEEGADLGVAFDGDADRCFFVDDTGEFVPGDFVTALLAELMLEKEPGAKIIYDVRASWAVPDTVRERGGEPLVNRVGHAFIKHRMREEDAVFGGEVSGHYYFREFSKADSGVDPVPADARAALEARRDAVGAPAPVPRRATSSPASSTRGSTTSTRSCASSRSGSARREPSRTSTASPSRPRTGTSTSARRTRSRCCASTWRRSAPRS